LEPGRNLLHYRLSAKIGEGGMGVVWRATDTTLDRDVAIKILPAAFTEDPDRLARFEREAKLLASLNHPHIAAIHSVHEAEGLRFLAMEYVEGEDLAERLVRGPLPLDDALTVASQVAAAVEAAHARGVIHRDLKPANVKLTPEGEVKVLDFGLAKALAESDPASADPGMSPTLTSAGTAAGAILGTAAYMSPEQARGRPADRRADTWAFGCLLYEMLCGERAFPGDTPAEALGAILHKEPEWEKLPAATPSSIRRLLERCLRKRRAQRLRDLGDAGLEIADAIEGDDAEPATPEDRSRSLLPWALAGLFFALAVLAFVMRPQPAPPRVTRTVVALPDDHALTSTIALSSDGTKLAFTAGAPGGEPRLFVRAMDRFDAVALPGTEGASVPFFSPDARWLGFVAGGKLQKVPPEGGAPLAICGASMAFGASWGPDDTIVLGGGLGSGLFRVSASGGTPERLTAPDPARGEVSHGWPHFLADGDTVLFTIGTERSSSLGLLSLENGEWGELNERGAGPRLLPNGRLVYSEGDKLRLVSFSPGSRRLTGDPTPILEGLLWQNFGGLESPRYAVSDNGTLAFASGDYVMTESRLVVVDREGNAEAVPLDAGRYMHPSLSPDGRRVALTTINEDLTGDISIVDLDRATRTRLTVEGTNYTPIWTPDGRSVTFVSNGNIAWKPADGSGELEILVESEEYIRPVSWSPDGKLLAYDTFNPEGRDVRVWSADGATLPALPATFIEKTPVFSPGGRWLAYVSNESGRDEIYVQSYPEPGGRWLVSAGGGREPVWAGDGSELFYRYGGRVMAVSVGEGPEPTFGRPRPLFEDAYFSQPIVINFDAWPDGQRFVMVEHEAGTRVRHIQVVQNWFEELEGR
jgi:serine/threonine-protein kinase